MDTEWVFEPTIKRELDFFVVMEIPFCGVRRDSFVIEFDTEDTILEQASLDTEME